LSERGEEAISGLKETVSPPDLPGPGEVDCDKPERGELGPAQGGEDEEDEEDKEGMVVEARKSLIASQLDFESLTRGGVELELACLSLSLKNEPAVWPTMLLLLLPTSSWVIPMLKASLEL